MTSTSKKRNNGYIPNSGYHLLQQSYTTSEELNEATRGWDIILNQLDPGPQLSEVFQLSGRFNLAQASFNRKMEQLGSSPKNVCTFIIPAYKELSYISRKKNISGNSIPIFNQEIELDSVSDNNFDIILFSIPLENVKQICRIQGIPRVFEAIHKHEVINCTPQQVELLRNDILQMISEIKNDPAKLINTNLIYELENTLPASLLETLAQPFEFSEPALTRKRTDAINKIKEYLHDHPTKPVTCEELCRITDYSKRTLEYVFQDYYGVSPKAYLKKLRLNYIYKELKKSNPKQVNVIDIANKWDFWHMGQFAADYRYFFGELPSETLSKPASMKF